MESDPAAGVGVLAALGAGLVSFLSPCVLPLVPGYLSAVTGVSAADLDRAGWRTVLLPSLVFVASFSAIFMLLGLGATGIGSALNDNRDTLRKVSGGVMVMMGAFFVVSFIAPRLNREWHVEALLARAGSGGPLIAGMAFAIAWTPCIGPTLAAILSAATLSHSEAHGALLLAFYSAGLGVPFLLTALAFSKMTTVFGWVKRHYAVIIGFGGVVLIATGVLIYTDEFFQLNIEAQKLLTNLGLDFWSGV
jgi:cytochrome c-type biogenesis protein